MAGRRHCSRRKSRRRWLHTHVLSLLHPRRLLLLLLLPVCQLRVVCLRRARLAAPLLRLGSAPPSGCRLRVLPICRLLLLLLLLLLVPSTCLHLQRAASRLSAAQPSPCSSQAKDGGETPVIGEPNELSI